VMGSPTASSAVVSLNFAEPTSALTGYATTSPPAGRDRHLRSRVSFSVSGWSRTEADDACHASEAAGLAV
jgi:hypothetical protein